MSDIEKSWLMNPSRRAALARVAGLIAASPAASALAQPDPRPLSAHRRIPSLAEMQTAFDFEPVFFGNVTQAIYDYTAHGEGSEFNLRRNREVFDWVDILASRAPITASQIDLSSELLGAKMKYPIMVAPTAAQVPLHPDGEKGMFQAATAASNTVMMLSNNTSTPVAEVAQAAPGGTLWGQLYPLQNEANFQRLIDTWQAAGCGAIAVTVDQQSSFYERTEQIRNLGGRVRTGPPGPGAGRPPPTGAARYRINPSRTWFTWRAVEQWRKMIKGPLVIKGLLVAEDARLAIEVGADAIVVSNHGGRSMDYAPSSLEVLPEIAAEVNGRVPILLDSGIRRGSDVFKALALGADGVMVGRAARWGLAAYGAPGAQRLFEILQQELVEAAAGAGCARLSDIDETKVRTHFT